MAYYRFSTEAGYEAYALRIGRYKLIRHRVGSGPFLEELYDVTEDPQEREPLEEQGARSKIMRARLEELLQGAGRADLTELDQRTLEELRALGYVR
jgi:hypothetical protein